MFKKLSYLLILGALLAACQAGGGVNNQTPSQGTNMPEHTETSQTGLANPASQNCIKLGGRLEIRKGADGGEVGICVFPNGKECEEWALMRGECSPTEENKDSAYHNADYGFTLSQPDTWSFQEKATKGNEPLTLTLKRDTLVLTLQVKRTSEDKTFAAAAPEGGEIKQQGTWTLAGQQAPLQVVLLEGKVKSASAIFTHDDVKIRCQLDDASSSEISAEQLQEAAGIVAALQWD